MTWERTADDTNLLSQLAQLGVVLEDPAHDARCCVRVVHNDCADLTYQAVIGLVSAVEETKTE